MTINYRVCIICSRSDKASREAFVEGKMSGSTHMVLSETMVKLTTELGEVCAHVQKLLSQMEVDGLTAEQAASILAELGAEVVHLHAHTDGLQEIINDELEKL